MCEALGISTESSWGQPVHLPPCHGGRKKLTEKKQLWLLSALSFSDLSSPAEQVSGVKA